MSSHGTWGEGPRLSFPPARTPRRGAIIPADYFTAGSAAGLGARILRASAGTVTDGVASLQVLTDAPPSDWVTERGVVFVPTLTRVAIGITVAFTVVFGIIPEPILDFAHQATLLFT